MSSLSTISNLPNSLEESTVYTAPGLGKNIGLNIDPHGPDLELVLLSNDDDDKAMHLPLDLEAFGLGSLKPAFETQRKLYWNKGGFGSAEKAGNGYDFEPIYHLNDSVSFFLGLSVYQTLRKNQDYDQEYVFSLLKSLITHLAALLERAKKRESDFLGGLTPFQIKKVGQFVKENIDRQITLQEMAALIRLSPFHFSRMFKKTTGYSPYQFVLNYKMNEAREMLMSSDLSISQISLEVGFESSGNFSRTFKKRFNLSPSELRTMMLV